MSLSSSDGLIASLSTTLQGFNAVLNQTSSSFGVNVDGTTCNGLEDSAMIDGGCGAEAIRIAFNQDVQLNSIKVSSFGTVDLGSVSLAGGLSTSIVSTGLLSFTNSLLKAGTFLNVGWVSGNGFSLDALTVTSTGTTAPVTTTPEPSTVALLIVGIATMGFAARARRRGASASA
jgi:hypothetical protein